MQSEDETKITEIELTPDGRIFVFGASREVLSLLDDLGLGDEALRSRLLCVETSSAQAVVSAGHCRTGDSRTVNRKRRL